MKSSVNRFGATLRRPNVWIPAIFFGMFAVIIAANGTMVFVAMNTWRGLQTENAYEKGVAYNQALEARDRQVALGWDLGVEVKTPGGQHANVRIALADAQGAPLIADRVRVGFVRPTQEGYDSIHELTGHGDGTYSASADLPLPGLWELRIVAEKGANALHETRRIMVAQ